MQSAAISWTQKTITPEMGDRTLNPDSAQLYLVTQLHLSIHVSIYLINLIFKYSILARTQINKIFNLKTVLTKLLNLVYLTF